MEKFSTHFPCKTEHKTSKGYREYLKKKHVAGKSQQHTVNQIVYSNGV